MEEEDVLPEKAKMFFVANHPKLNEDQKFFFDFIKELILEMNREGKLVLLDAPGGTGKTFTLNVLVSWIRMQDLEVTTSATT